MRKAYTVCIIPQFPQEYATILDPSSFLVATCRTMSSSTPSTIRSIEPHCESDLGILEKGVRERERATAGDWSRQMTCVETPPSPTFAKTKQKPEPIPPEGMAIHGKIRGAGDTPTRTSDCCLCCAALPPAGANPIHSAVPSRQLSPLQNRRTVADHRHAFLRVPGTPGLCDNKFLPPHATVECTPGDSRSEHDIKVHSMGGMVSRGRKTITG